MVVLLVVFSFFVVLLLLLRNLTLIRTLGHVWGMSGGCGVSGLERHLAVLVCNVRFACALVWNTPGQASFAH